MTEHEAEDVLAGHPLVAVMQGSMADIRILRDRCLDAQIPAVMDCPQPRGKGWGTKLVLLVREADIPSVAQLLHSEWHEMVAREGTSHQVDLSPNEAGDLPCPACGTAAPLIQGACSDCGLVLDDPGPSGASGCCS